MEPHHPSLWILVYVFGAQLNINAILVPQCYAAQLQWRSSTQVPMWESTFCFVFSLFPDLFELKTAKQSWGKWLCWGFHILCYKKRNNTSSGESHWLCEMFFSWNRLSAFVAYLCLPFIPKTVLNHFWLALIANTIPICNPKTIHHHFWPWLIASICS
jgi:hypothetical protein